MGGINSTRWTGHSKKTTVEDCLSLEVEALLNRLGRDLLTHPAHRIVAMAWVDERSGFPGSVEVYGDSRLGTIRLQLRYQAYDGFGSVVDTATEVELLPSETNFSGLRYWFACPVCRRRIGKLYLPLNRLNFACRHCHKLTYKSAQTAHTLATNQRIERLEKMIPESKAKK